MARTKQVARRACSPSPRCRVSRSETHRARRRPLTPLNAPRLTITSPDGVTKILTSEEIQDIIDAWVSVRQMYERRQAQDEDEDDEEEREEGCERKRQRLSPDDATRLRTSAAVDPSHGSVTLRRSAAGRNGTMSFTQQRGISSSAAVGSTVAAMQRHRQGMAMGGLSPLQQAQLANLQVLMRRMPCFGAQASLSECEEDDDGDGIPAVPVSFLRGSQQAADGQWTRPVSETASRGEFSRFMGSMRGGKERADVSNLCLRGGRLHADDARPTVSAKKVQSRRGAKKEAEKS